MNVYVAGRTKNLDEVHAIQEVVMERGHAISHDWTDPDIGEVRDTWTDDPTRARQVATLDFLASTTSDGIILCGYGCEEGGGGLGCFIEAGLAMASGVPMIVLGPIRESVFWYAPFVLKVNYAESEEVMEARRKRMAEHGLEMQRDDVIKLEAAIAVDGLESLNRQKRLALNQSDTRINL